MQRFRSECAVADVNGSKAGRGDAMDHRGKYWCGCPFAAANALRTAPGGKGSRGFFVLVASYELRVCGYLLRNWQPATRNLMRDLRIIFLGTSAGMPTRARNVA